MVEVANFFEVCKFIGKLGSVPLRRDLKYDEGIHLPMFAKFTVSQHVNVPMLN